MVIFGSELLNYQNHNQLHAFFREERLHWSSLCAGGGAKRSEVVAKASINIIIYIYVYVHVYIYI